MILKTFIGNNSSYSYPSTIQGSKNKISITCNIHGEFLQTPDNHLQGQGCPKCGITSNKEKQVRSSLKWVSAFKEVHGDKYIYPDVIEGCYNLISIYCKKHNMYFLQAPFNHKRGQGCSKCAKENHSIVCRKDYKEYLNMFEVVHGKRYEYPEDRDNNYLDITCKEHGVFKMLPTVHANGVGCPKCSRKKNSGNSWGYSEWIKYGMLSKHFDSFKVYILKCFDEETKEEFIKVGRTFNKVSCRFGNTTLMPYKYEVLKEFIFEDGVLCCKFEQYLKNKFKQFSYFPLKDFGGKYECFEFQDINSIVNEITLLKESYNEYSI